VFLRFQEENTFWQKILSRVGNDQLSIHFTRLLDYLKSREFFARESCSWAKIPLPKNLSRKIARFFVSKISPATGVTIDKRFQIKNKNNTSSRKEPRNSAVK